MRILEGNFVTWEKKPVLTNFKDPKESPLKIVVGPLGKSEICPYPPSHFPDAQKEAKDYGSQKITK